ncbi:IucA/IucC family siderophore biosynthesis protein [Bacillus sp. SH8-8]|uniref:IucA/IucC family siderophore biosynthesis protein n=1 Tax=Bacillus sp. SH8-8 TaxID=2217830 RepID=UPI0034D74D2D
MLAPLQLELEQDELKIHEFLTRKHPKLAREYLNVIGHARFSIMERLVNALLREELLNKIDCDINFIDSNTISFCCFNQRILIMINQKYSFNRYELAGNVIYYDNEGNKFDLIHPIELLDILINMAEKQGISYSNKDIFRKEIGSSVANMALAMAYQKISQQRFKKLSNLKNGCDTITLLKEIARENSLFDKSMFFEEMCVTGHQQHPCTKSKGELSIEEVLRYSPEFKNKVEISFVALHKEVTLINSSIEMRDVNEIWFNEYPGLQTAFYNSCQKNKVKIEEFVLIPVHPWQKEHTIPEMYSEEFSNGFIIHIDDFILDTRPTLSFRTVSPVLIQNHYHLKLPVNVQMTSAIRTISPNSIKNGPEISRILKKILGIEQNFNDKFEVAEEIIGIRYGVLNKPDTDNFEKNKNLSVLIRENPNKLLKENEVAIIAAALYNQSPISEKPLVCEIIENYISTHKFNNSQEGIIEFFTKYVTVLLNGVLPLMTRYGIGLEAHLQNSIIVFNRDEPIKVIMRDLGGVRIDKNRLEKQGFTGDYYKNSVTIVESPIEVQKKVIHTAFQSHIGELTLHLSRHYKINESNLWCIVKDISLSVFSELKKDNNLKNEVETDMKAIFAPSIETKALTVMRLNGHITNYDYLSILNPLNN